jgi:hypothetical protein
MRLARFVLLPGLPIASPAWAQEIDQLQNAAQAEFRLLSEDLGAALSYHAQTPSAPLGITGFDLGIGVTATRLEHPGILQRVTSDESKSTVVLPTARVHKGLPLGFDLGLTYAGVPGSNIRYAGGELRYAILEGDYATPAIGVRASLTRLSGVSQLALETRGLDVSISKGFALFTPYAGAGRVWVESDPRGVPALAVEKFSMTRVFVGLGMNFVALNINLEAARTGDATSTSLKAGWRF